MSYKICEIAGCDNHLPADRKFKYCLYHRHLLDRPCAYYFYKKEGFLIPVEWCNKYNKRYDDLPCKYCPDWEDPLEALEKVIKINNKKGG